MLITHPELKNSEKLSNASTTKTDHKNKGKRREREKERDRKKRHGFLRNTSVINDLDALTADCLCNVYLKSHFENY